MSSIDERIVQMHFDNKEFERNIKTSMDSLSNLKKSLDFKGCEKGLDTIAKSADKVDMGVMINALDTASNKFDAMRVVAITSLSRITNAVIDAGVNFVKSLSIDNVIAGWSKLEKKANSMSTLVSQGFDLETVEKQVERLNWFSDETSYNFTDMVDSVAKFTSTGKGLEDSVTALEGIALWAAKSGQNATGASRAMYQLSQAMGTGVMRKEDWKSIENLNMSTVEFKQTAIDTAVELGTLRKQANGTYVSLRANTKAGKEAFTATSKFNDSLTEGLWFTDKVMLKTYEKYGKGAEQVKNIVESIQNSFGEEVWTTEILRMYKALNGLDKSGKTFEQIVTEGEYSEEVAVQLKEMISGLDEFGVKALIAGQEYRTFTDVIDSTRDAVSTKWMNIMGVILGDLDEQKALWTTIGESLYDTFAAPLTAIENKMKSWVELGGRSDLFEGFSNAISFASNLVGIFKEAFRDIFPSKSAEQLASITSAFKVFTERLKLSDTTTENLKRTFKGIFALFDIGIEIIKGISKAFFNLIGYTKPAGEGLLAFTANIGDFIVKVRDAIKQSELFIKGFKFISDVLGNAISGVTTFIKSFITALKEFMHIDTSGIEGFGEKFKKAFEPITKIGDNLSKKFGGITEIFNKFLLFMSGFASKIAKVLKAIWEPIGEAIRNAKFNTVIDLINALLKGRNICWHY